MSVTDTTAWIIRTRQRKDLPPDVKETMVETIIRHRQFLERTLGELELSYLRGKQGPLHLIEPKKKGKARKPSP